MAATNGIESMENGTNENSKLIPLEPIDQWRPIDNIRTIIFIIIRQILDEDAMRDALDRLIRDYLPIIGARIEIVSKDGDLAYRVPSSFPADYKLFQWSRQIVDSSFAAAEVLPGTSLADSDIFHGPCSIPELENKWTPLTWPRERHSEDPDLPLLLVHITKYTDATIVSMNLPHAVSDQMGIGSLITAWTQVMKGETPAEFLKLEPGALDGLRNLSEKELRKKRTFRITTKLERARAILSFLPDLILNPKEIRQTLFLPISLIEELRDRHTQDLKNRYGDKAVVLTSGDIVTSLLTKFAYIGRKTSRNVTITTVINGRGRCPAVPADKPYLHNCTCYAVVHTPNPDKVSLAELAYRHRLGVLEGLKSENIERSLAITKELWKRKYKIHIVEPGDLSYACTNWCGAWRNIDFRPTIASKEGTAANGGSTAPPLIFGHSLQRTYPTRYNTQIMCKGDGGFWCDFTISTKTHPLLERLLKSDPRLCNF
ncbi:BCL5p [Penicillium longicatenatum]|uniref:BCL5p n=1 Tax=Penicillium longicatenatum TaxID=1561947 RepID=UPI0025485310|nr:BCL5p [Penicillium longicatenatum]KAJ5631782.1 BCL5p [Penicillium longicatenatum]